MHISFTQHTPSLSLSCKNIIEYLEKENETNNIEKHETEKAFYIREKEININNKEFFSINNNEVDKNEVIKQIDDNYSDRHKNEQAKFYMINVSPDKKELEHLDNLVDAKINEMYSKKELKIINKNEQTKIELEKIKSSIKDQYIQEYIKNIMENYANNFNRYVFNEPEKLPPRRTINSINKQAKEDLDKLKINIKDEKYSTLLQQRKEMLAKELGFDLSVRKMESKDLKWFAKIETTRTYKANDRWVFENKKTLKEIEILKNQKPKNIKGIQELEKKLHRDKTTNEIVKEGMRKGGDNTHIHIVVSRYDNCLDKHFKASLSPLANQKKSKIADKNSVVGFNRKDFIKSNEATFDKLFNFQRQFSFEKYNNAKKNQTQIKQLGKTVLSKPFSKIQEEFKKNIGFNELNKLNPLSEINKISPIPIPIVIPTKPSQIIMQTLKTVYNMMNKSITR